MHGLSRWCMTHRRWVVITWVAIAIIANVVASVVGRQYASNFSLPGTESQHVVDLLTSQFKAQSGDVDTIVFHYANGRYDAPAVKAAIEPLLTKVAADPHVVSVLSPYGPQGAAAGLQGRSHRVRDGQLLQARKPAGRQHRQAGAQADRRRPRPRAANRGRRPGDREGRGLQHRAGDATSACWRRW